MQWLTKEQIKERSTSPWEAFTVSIEKYEYWLTVGEIAMKCAIKEDMIGWDETWCGCCIWYGHTKKSHGGCPLYTMGSGWASCCIEYKHFIDTKAAWKEGEANYVDVQDAVKILIYRLTTERAKLPPEKEVKKGKKPKHGDYDAYELFLERAPWLDDDDETCEVFPAGKEGAYTNISAGDNRLILGNIFTELEALKEPLENFCASGIEFKMADSGYLHIIGCERDFVFPSHKIPEIILNLRRLYTTAVKERSMTSK